MEPQDLTFGGTLDVEGKGPSTKTRLFGWNTFLLFVFLGSYYITMKPEKYMLFPQALLNSLKNGLNLGPYNLHHRIFRVQKLAFFFVASSQDSAKEHAERKDC